MDQCGLGDIHWFIVKHSNESSTAIGSNEPMDVKILQVFTMSGGRLRSKIPRGKFAVSLYAVDQYTHDKIFDWFATEVDSGNHAGFTKILEKYKLDAVELIRR